MKLELAIWLYAQGRLSIGKARELAGLSLWEFRQMLSAKRIAAQFGLDDLQDDLAAMVSWAAHDRPQQYLAADQPGIHRAI